MRGNGCVLLMLMLAWFGCDSVQDRGAATVSLTLRGADDVSTSHERCASSIERAVLEVNGRRFSETVRGDTVEFAVSGIRRGEVVARAAILSNTSDTLWVGEDRRRIDEADFGVIEIDLVKRNPVLEVCPDSVVIDGSSDFQALLAVRHRGSERTGTSADTLSWTTSEAEVCEGQSCLLVRPWSDTVLAGSVSQVVLIGRPAGTSAVVQVLFTSPHGSAQVEAYLAEDVARRVTAAAPVHR